MLYLLIEQSSLSVPIWLAILLALITPSLALIGVWLTRKRLSSVKAEDKKTGAETQRLQIQIQGDLWDQLHRTRTELTETVNESAEKARELRELHAKQVEFLQAQVEIKTEAEYEARHKEQKARDRFHASQNEIQRCIFVIHHYEELLRHCQPKIEFTPFDFTPYKEIMEGHTHDNDAPAVSGA